MSAVEEVIGSDGNGPRHAVCMVARMPLTHNTPMSHAPIATPPFVAPVSYSDPAAALAQVQRLYDQAIAHLRTSLAAFVTGQWPEGQRARACYPFVRLQTHTALRPDGADKPLSYGFVSRPGAFATATFAVRRLRLAPGIITRSFGCMSPLVNNMR